MDYKKFTSTNAVVYTAILAALYMALNAMIAPLAYGPLQFRVSNFLYPLALFNPLFGLGFGLGAFLTNLGSPFGPWDFVVMPIITVAAAFTAWGLRKVPTFGLSVQAFLIALGVSIFPLWMGGQIPPMATFPGVFLSNLFIVLAGWFILWRPMRKTLEIIIPVV